MKRMGQGGKVERTKPVVIYKLSQNYILSHMVIPQCSICMINTIPCVHTSMPPAVPILILTEILNLGILSLRNPRLLPQKHQPGPAPTRYNSTIIIIIIRWTVDDFRFLPACHILPHLHSQLSGASLRIAAREVVDE
ncbi:hypothetical protein L873DRAFT_140933 [Choiromyces venosus 120613-1]|uniref:Uncharacterized protein n=1 Tax=Choiromyces venosus 120613-1 TaxID=1336337 RepID=A0A3N4J6X2_9PEZI|nr:hypothetical protein L873DRAFT_140933 [Choiromyces venosus 120613-1]